MAEQGAFWEPTQQADRGFMLKAATVEWATPRWLFDPLHAEFNFTIDVAAAYDNAKCERYYTKEQDGLAQDWRSERVWINPPYGADELLAFSRKAWETTRADPTSLVVMLVPVKSDQPWWHRYAIHSEVRFVPGRVKFGNALNSAPMPVAVIVMSQRHGAAMYSFDAGQLAVPLALDTP